MESDLICPICKGKKNKKAVTCSVKCRGLKRRNKKTVQCHFCNKKFEKHEYRIRRCKKHFCSNKCKDSGLVGIHSSKIKDFSLDRSYFKEINTWEKAYILGWIASDGHVSRVGFVIGCCDIEIIKYIKQQIGSESKIREDKRSGVKICYRLEVRSIEMSNDLQRHLKINYGKKSHKVVLPDLNGELLDAFMLGYFEGDGCVFKMNIPKQKYGACSITSESKSILKQIQHIYGGSVYNNKIEWYGNNASNFLKRIYKNNKFNLNRKLERAKLIWERYSS